MKAWSILTTVVLVIAFSTDIITKNYFATNIVLNSGVSLGVGEWWSPHLLLMVQIGVLGAVAVACYRWRVPWIATGLLLGGGAANLWDRWQFGAVRDWLTVPGLGLKNNFADWWITIAVVLILFWSIYGAISQHSVRR